MTPGLRGDGIQEGAGTSLPHSCKRSSEKTNSPLGFGVCGRGGVVSPTPTYLPKGWELVPYNPTGLCCFHSTQLAESQHCKGWSLEEVDAMER